MLHEFIVKSFLGQKKKKKKRKCINFRSAPHNTEETGQKWTNTAEHFYCCCPRKLKDSSFNTHKQCFTNLEHVVTLYFVVQVAIIILIIKHIIHYKGLLNSTRQKSHETTKIV